MSVAEKAAQRQATTRPKHFHEAQIALLEAVEELSEPGVPLDLWKAIKGSAILHAIPTQLFLEDSLAVEKSPRGVQDVATRAWNFTVALYHKAGGSPWRLAEVDPGVCFVGVSFFRLLYPGS